MRTRHGKKRKLLKSPKAKIIVMLDHDIQRDLIDYTTADSSTFKIIKIADGQEEDPELFNEATEEGAILITKDADFWNDNRYSLTASSGIIVVRGDNGTSVTKAFDRFLHKSNIVDEVRQNPKAMFRKKYKVSTGGFIKKFLDNSSKRRVEYRTYTKSS